MKRILLLDGYFVQAYSVSKSLRLSGFEVTLLTSEVVSYGFLADIHIKGFYLLNLMM